MPRRATKNCNLAPNIEPKGKIPTRIQRYRHLTTFDYDRHPPSGSYSSSTFCAELHLLRYQGHYTFSAPVAEVGWFAKKQPQKTDGVIL